MNHSAAYWGVETGFWPEAQRYYAINYQGFQMAPHQHDHMEVMYVVTGKCQVSCWEKDVCQDIPLGAGSFVVVRSGVLHELRIPDGAACRVLNLEFGCVPATGLHRPFQSILMQSTMIRRVLKAGEPCVVCHDPDGRIHGRIVSLQRQISGVTGPDGHLTGNLVQTELLLALAEHCAEAGTGRLGVHYVRKALEFIENHYEQDIRAEDIARFAGVSVAHLQRLFRQSTGMSLMQKLCRTRIHQARILLETSSLPVVDIAVQVGFHSRQYFSQVFMQEEKCPPAVYRRHRGNTQMLRGF